MLNNLANPVISTDLMKLYELDRAYLIEFSNIERKNSVNIKFIKDLAYFIKKVDEEKKYNILILKGIDNYFCTGFDFREMEGSLDQLSYDETVRTLSFLATSESFLTVAIVNGFAIGWGVELVVACDISIVDSKSFLKMPNYSYQVHPDFFYYLTKLKNINQNTFNRLFVFESSFKPDEAKKEGLITEVSDNYSGLLNYIAADYSRVSLYLEYKKIRNDFYCGDLNQYKKTVKSFQQNWFSKK